MPTIGDVWKVALGDTVRIVKVVAATESPSWWRCVDVETGVSFYASERWLFEPANEKWPRPPDTCGPSASHPREN